MKLEYCIRPAWPALAWLAKCPVNSASVEVYHGGGVELDSTWYCEAVWDSDYTAGNFDQTDVVFGSGGRLRDGGVTFTSSASTVDRLHHLSVDGAIWVSNSLACLLAGVGAVPDPTYSGYYRDFETIIFGINRYKRTVATSRGSVGLTYFNNLQWNGQTLVEVEKPCPSRDLRSFTEYRGFIESGLVRIADNLSAVRRQFRYAMLGTLSSGYDSLTVAVLARKSGLRQAISFALARGGAVDDGREFGDLLGLEVSVVSRDDWRSQSMPEVPFIAADAKGEDVYFAGAEETLRGRVLLTGFHGDKVWNKHLKVVNSELVRGDQSGLALAEYRLWAGFIHLPVPFIGVKQLPDINAISNDPEMAEWDVGGAYNRPICRRVIEEAGIPRGRFALSKKAASVLFFGGDGFLSPASLLDYQSWLKSESREWKERGKLPPLQAAKLWTAVRPITKIVALGIRLLVRTIPKGGRRLISRLEATAKTLQPDEYLFRHLFPWAIARAKQRYGNGWEVSSGQAREVDTE